MKKTLKISLIALVAMGAMACNKQKANDNTADTGTGAPELTQEEIMAIQTTMDSLSNAKDRFIWPDSTENIFKVPDSIVYKMLDEPEMEIDITDLWTPEQKAIGRKIAKVYAEKIRFDGKQLIFDISREEFVEKGIPEAYYFEMKQSISDMNIFNRLYKQSPESIEADWNVMKGEFEQMYEKASE